MRSLFLYILCGLSLFSTDAFGLDLFVASSFERVARRIEPTAKIHVDGSSRLAQQVIAGAQPDVLISANRYWVDEVKAQFPDAQSYRIASNALVLASLKTSRLNPEDFCKLRLAASMVEVPSGKYADMATQILGCEKSEIRAPNVSVVRTWILEGNVNAGFVYASDIVSEPRLHVSRVFSRDEIKIDIYGISFTPPGKQFLEKVKNSSILEVEGFTKPEGHELLSTRVENMNIDIYRVLFNSSLVGLVVVIFSFFPATYLGFLLARMRSRWKVFLSVIVMSPLVIPPVVTGLVLLKLFSKNGVFSSFFAWVGFYPAFTWVGALIAAFVVAFPLFVIMSRRAFETIEPSLETVGKTCGLSKQQVFWRISFPMAFPGIIAGAMLVFARSLGEFGATAVFAGNLAAEGGTISLAIYRALQTPDSAETIWVLSIFSVLLSVIAILAFEYFAKKQKDLLRMN